MDRNFQIFLLVVALWLIGRRAAKWAGAMKGKFWLSALIVFMLISILWSPVLFVSLKRWISEILAVVLGLLISTEDKPRQAIQCILRRTVYILIPFSVILIKYFPQYGIQHHHWSGIQTWVGVASQKNGLGILASLASFFLVWSLVNRLKRFGNQGPWYQTVIDISILSLSFWLLKGPGTYSATSVVMLAGGLFLYVVFLPLKKRLQYASGNIWVVIMGLVIVYGIATPLIGKLPFGDFSSDLGRNSTLTGRSDIWAALVPVALSKPVLGHGWGGFWTTAARERYVFPAHNGYLETLLVLGFFGLLLFSLFMLSSCRMAIKELGFEYDWGVLWICWLFMALLNNITESTLPHFSNLLIALPVWLTITFKDEKRSV